MSAFITSLSHVDVVVGGLARKGIITEAERDAVGALLHGENVTSVNFRYSESTAPEAYTYTEHEFVSDAVVSKLASSLDYQSCEHPEYRSSEASRLLTELTDLLSSTVDREGAEYAAAPWEVDEGFTSYVYDPSAHEGRTIVVTTAVTAA